MLFGTTGYTKLTDFGFAKIVSSRIYTLCGTAQYLVPEILSQKGYGKGVDWWTDAWCFHLQREYKFSKYFSDYCRDLIRHLLQSDTSRRFGCLSNGTSDIKSHKWFKNMNWIALYHKNIRPEYVPQILERHELEFFENKTELNIQKSPTMLFPEEFEDF
ncbi:unnamed protein product [Didymodactylos carnosus]|uniref:Uncharacterized protein n=1 Tax=Didymodactylos carnosus TaxID=1234261 RepID=A0A813WYQ4_9BILA|nr:unnamed protein product [Didymodactylos carnosus]CAF0959836.1 unnamed protein product [Didymodactylos carnosus]CAF3645103.1 unnamed protein product [Didymodactylos carnosus]CAF3732675.1 unnamed protein product [Didymodactylos carnosus]